PTRSLIAIVRAAILSLDVDASFLWDAIRVLAQRPHHAAIAGVIRATYEIGFSFSDLGIEPAAGLRACAPLWDPVSPRQLDQLCLRKLLRVMCAERSKALTLRGCLPGVVPSCIFHLTKLEEL